MTDTHRVDPARLQEYCSELFVHAGMNETDASNVVKNLIDADLHGVESHGVSRVAIYLKRLRVGVVRAKTHRVQVKDYPAVGVWDACNSMGACSSLPAMQEAIDKARVTGMSMILVRNSNHYGRAAYYTEMGISENMIGFSATNGSPRMAPWGAKDPYFGTNPFSFAIPTGQEMPLVVDLATSVVARGKITVAAKNNRDIPLGWALDRDGNATTNARAALDGTVLPFGGPKGSAIAMVLDILTGMLSGSIFGVHLPDMMVDFNNPAVVSHAFCAVDISKFTDVDEFKRDVQRMISEIRGLSKAQGVEKVFLPGEIEFQTRQERLKHGIPLNSRLLRELKSEGECIGIPFFLSI